MFVNLAGFNRIRLVSSFDFYALHGGSIHRNTVCVSLKFLCLIMKNISVL